MNSCCFIGRLVHTPRVEVLENEKQTKVVNFTIAVFAKNGVKGSDDKAFFYDCKAWGENAEFLAKYFVKGENIGVNGELRYDVYLSKEEKKRRRYYINVQNISFCESKEKSNKGKRPEDYETEEDFLNSIPDTKD